MTASSEFVFGDPLPDAPELAHPGPYAIGVQTLTATDPGRLDIVNIENGVPPLYDRKFTLEVWYPTDADPAEHGLIEYDQVTGTSDNPDRPNIPFTFSGRAIRNAPLSQKDASYPLVIYSHGYVGSRLMLSYLTENLASKGYVVVAIDHPDSTYSDAAPFPSTLYNRSFDQLFVLNEIARLSAADSGHFLAGRVDVDHTALIGYSMGGYGALNTAGAGYSPGLIDVFAAESGGSRAIEVRTEGHPEYEGTADPRIKCMIAFAPWGRNHDVWSPNALANIEIPTLLVAGADDDVSGYEGGVKSIFNEMIHAERYMLTYLAARHNVAPNPPHPFVMNPDFEFDEYARYAEFAWDERRINNINQHFITAFIGIHLKQLPFEPYLDLVTSGTQFEEESGVPWKGFKPRTAVGLEFRVGKARA